MKSIYRKCGSCGLDWLPDEESCCKVCGSKAWHFECKKHGLPAEEDGCPRCAYVFNASPYLQPAQLGAALFADRVEGEKAVATASISVWLRESREDMVLADKVATAERHPVLSARDRYSLVTMLLRGDNLSTDTQRRAGYDRILSVLKAEEDRVKAEKAAREEAARKRKEDELRRARRLRRKAMWKRFTGSALRLLILLAVVVAIAYGSYSAWVARNLEKNSRGQSRFLAVDGSHRR